MTKKNEKNTKATKNEKPQVAGLLTGNKDKELSERGKAALKDPRWKPGQEYTKELPDKDGKKHTLTLTCKADGFYVGGKRYDTPTSATQAFCVGILGWSDKARRPPAALFGLWKSPNAEKAKPAAKKPAAKKAKKAIKKPAAKPTKKPAAKAAKPAAKPPVVPVVAPTV